MDLSFEEKLTFLYGLNGSGKTTALKLMMALLDPSLGPLVKTPFRTLELEGTTQSHGNITVVATKEKDKTLTLKCSVVPDELLTINLDNIDVDDDNDVQVRNSRQNPVISALSDIASPIFLGIDRRFKVPRRPVYRRQPTSSRQMAFEFQHERNLEDPSFDPGLGEVAFVIEDFTSLLRRRQAGIDDRFRKQILLDSFAYIDPEAHGFSFEPSEEMFQAFRGKRKAIMHTLNSLNLASEEFEKRSETFFTTIENVIGTIRKLKGKKVRGTPSKELTEALTAWFVNQSQVDRIDRLFDLTNNYRDEQESVLRPLHEFVALTNRFFSQTGKEVIIDRAGEVKIQMKNRTTSLQALSSGERQIFIMLAHLSLNRRLLKDGVFIVDEPELSLHIAWQNMFVEAIETANPKLQVILATHAPAIIGGRDSLCIPVSSVDGE